MSGDPGLIGRSVWIGSRVLWAEGVGERDSLTLKRKSRPSKYIDLSGIKCGAFFNNAFQVHFLVDEEVSRSEGLPPAALKTLVFYEDRKIFDI